MVLSTSNPEQESWFKDQPCVMLALTPTPGANPLLLSAEVNALLPDIVDQLPPGLELTSADLGGGESVQISWFELEVPDATATPPTVTSPTIDPWN